MSPVPTKDSSDFRCPREWAMFILDFLASNKSKQWLVIDTVGGAQNSDVAISGFGGFGKAFATPSETGLPQLLYQQVSQHPPHRSHANCNQQRTVTG